MASENETVEAAIDAVRKMIHDCPAIKGGLGEFGYQLKANGAIDRIEAAHKREVAELREYLKANTVGVKAMHEEIETLRGMITDLRAKLKIEEDALEKCKKCGWVECDTIANALAAIREEGGSKINAKCVACPVKANCSGCPRGEYCDESNCPKMQGGAS